MPDSVPMLNLDGILEPPLDLEDIAESAPKTTWIDTCARCGEGFTFEERNNLYIIALLDRDAAFHMHCFVAFARMEGYDTKAIIEYVAWFARLTIKEVSEYLSVLDVAALDWPTTLEVGTR